jgi:hypothetical protein
MQAIHKRLIMQYRKNGNEYVDYIIEDKEGYGKSIAPLKWLRLDLPDATTEHQEKRCYAFLIKKMRAKMNFGRFIDIDRANKKKGITLDMPKEYYLTMI